MRRTLTRKELLKAAGAGTGLALIGGGALAGCDAPERLPRLLDDAPNPLSEPNVVVVIIDSLRKDHVGAYGNTWIQTPNLDALAGESLRFTRAYPESIPTICARRAIHTGTRTWPFRDFEPSRGDDVFLAGWQPIPRGQTTLAEVMRESGYQTLFVTDNQHQYKPSYNFQRGFDAFDYFRGQTTDNYAPNWTYPPGKVEQALKMEDYFRQYFSNVAGRRSEEDWFAPKVFSRASEFLDAASEPFFMVVDSYDPHAPYDPPEEYVTLYDDEPYDGGEPLSPRLGPSTYYTERQLTRLRARYAGEVTMVDRWLGRFVDELEERELLDNTLLLLISDHGIAHGEHGVAGKAPSVLWPEVTDIVFMMRHPEGKGAGQTSDFYASTHDVAPTVLGFLGIEPPEPLEGQNLSVLFDGGNPRPRDHFTLGYHDHVWTRDDDYAMFARNDGTQARLFDLRQDPNMDKDIAPSNPTVVRDMLEGYAIQDANGPLPNF